MNIPESDYTILKESKELPHNTPDTLGYIIKNIIDLYEQSCTVAFMTGFDTVTPAPSATLVLCHKIVTNKTIDLASMSSHLVDKPSIEYILNTQLKGYDVSCIYVIDQDKLGRYSKLERWNPALKKQGSLLPILKPAEPEKERIPDDVFKIHIYDFLNTIFNLDEFEAEEASYPTPKKEVRIRLRENIPLTVLYEMVAPGKSIVKHNTTQQKAPLNISYEPITRMITIKAVGRGIPRLQVDPEGAEWKRH